MKTSKTCPICTKALKKIKNEYVCPECGYRVLVSKLDGTTASTSAGSPSGTSSSATSGKKPAVHNFKPGILTIVILLLIIAAIIAASALIAKKMLTSDNDKSNGKKNNSSPVAEAEAESETRQKNKLDDIKDKQDNKKYMPETDAIIELCEIIFEKPLSSITSDELDSVTYLDFYMLDSSNMAVEFELDDGTSATCFMSYSDIDTADLKCFSGLSTILLEDMSIDRGTDWSMLNNLIILQADAGMDEVAECMDASQLIYLEIGGTYSADFSRASEFTSLTYLYVDMYYYDSLDGLSAVPSLETLVLENADSINDFSELYDMTYLTGLSIEGSRLKDISFISDYDALEELELIGTSVKNIDVIADCADTLTTLRLHRNDALELSDYDIVKSCTNLQTLELYPDYDFDNVMEVPDLSDLTQLTSLTLGNYDYFDNIGSVDGVTELTLSIGSYSDDGSVLSHFPNLVVLTLDDMSVRPSFFTAIPEMSQLAYISLTDTYLWGDISSILAAPALERLYLTDSTIGINESLPAYSDTVMLLDLEGTDFYLLNDDGSYNYGGTTMLSLDENTYFFDAFPKLQVLYTPGQELGSLDFVSKMPYLFYLDISDNYISDLSALTELSGLEMVICTDNPVKNTDGLDDVIIIQ